MCKQYNELSGKHSDNVSVSDLRVSYNIIIIFNADWLAACVDIYTHGRVQVHGNRCIANKLFDLGTRQQRATSDNANGPNYCLCLYIHSFVSNKKKIVTKTTYALCTQRRTDR